jgi:hypothetical protein
MYLKSFRIERIKCFEDLDIQFPHDDADYSGWVVLLGGNGMGKTTLLQAMALGLVGPLVGQRLLLSPNGWVRANAEHGEFEAEIVKGEGDVAAGYPRKHPYKSHCFVTGNEEVSIDGRAFDQPQIVLKQSSQKSLASGPYAAKKPGWFACGYGPFRRLLGGALDEAGLVLAAGRESRFATLFREAAALVECTAWLPLLYNRSKDPNHPERDRAAACLEKVTSIIDYLLPGEVHIDHIDADRVYFRSIGGTVVPVLDLSDGYRSFLALAIDILRHLGQSLVELDDLITPSPEGMQVGVEGVVLIDEVDAHLHPLWQRKIGHMLCRVFPKLQFVVSSHSPFVAQSATDGGLVILRPSGEKGVDAVRDFHSVRGWRVDQILTSPLFGLSGTRDFDTEQLIREHADLVGKRQWAALSDDEQRRLAAIEAKLADRLTGPGETPGDVKRENEMQSFVDRTLQDLEVSDD